MKYIIDVPEEIAKISEEFLSKAGLLCEPYTDIDIKEKAEEFGRGYDAGWDAGSKFHEAEKESIEDEVWDLADYMCRMSQTEKSRCFGFSYPSEVTTNLTYQEAKSLFEKWMEQKDEIKVGDEIVGIYSDGEKSPPLVVLKVEGNYYYGMYSKTGEFVQGGLNYEKTGRHFPEVAELLEKMREDSDEK